MSSMKPNGKSPSDDNSENTYRLSKESPLASEGIVPPPPVKNYITKKSATRTAVGGTLIGFNLLVFVTSVCVMTLELTASRLIAKHVGSSLYTWTSVIGVVLAGITLGNWLGGWMADRYNRSAALAWMYLLGSISCGSVLWLDQIVGSIQRPESLNWPQWVLTLVGSIFLIPAMTLGATSPLVASMALDRSVKTGSTVGNVYAWGALGSIVGTFLTGFYLIDVWGTRSIVGMTAGTLAILAVIVAGSRFAFRTGVILGWFQLLGWMVLAATSNGDAFAEIGRTAADGISMTRLDVGQFAPKEKCVKLGREIGEKLHELGLLLSLRNDAIHDYHDESNYSDIVIEDSEVGMKTIKALKLDKLIHSYYDPADPATLYYDYELIYAAVTKRVANSSSNEPVTLSLAGLQEIAITAEKLPEGVTIDGGNGSLRIEHPSNDVFTALIALAPEADYWAGIEQLRRESNRADWGGFSSVSLLQLPDGSVIPDDLTGSLRYDESLRILVAYRPLSQADCDRLIDNTKSGQWYQEIQRQWRTQRKATACFYGGGGYVFPRWFLEEFPGSNRIDVAEIDPAVLKAVQTHLGLTDELAERIKTTIGDARNFVDDRLRENAERQRRNEPSIQYDFIYGDAFNDFSIPWHLTTFEFMQNTRKLLSENGVFQANIIDIYPRCEYPGVVAGRAEAEYIGRLPNGVTAEKLRRDNRFVPAAKAFAPLEVMETVTNQFRLQVQKPLSQREEQRLKKVEWPEVKSATQYDVANGVLPEVDQAAERRNWQKAIETLSTTSRKKRGFGGGLPDVLKLTNCSINRWTAAAAPFEFVEATRLDESSYVLGFRGQISKELGEKLINLGPKINDWVSAVSMAVEKTKTRGTGRFLGRYVATAVRVFPNVYLFSTATDQPDVNRDTFVMVCAQRPLDLKSLVPAGSVGRAPFASFETLPANQSPILSGQMDAVLGLAEGLILTDDFAPVDNLLMPVVNLQE